MELDPTQIDALSRLSVVAFFILLTGLWLKRVIITHKEKAEAIESFAARLAEKDAEVAYQRGLVKELTRRLIRFQAVLERVTGVQVPPDPDDE